MEQVMMQSTLDGVVEETDLQSEVDIPLEVQSLKRVPSYHATPVPLVNNLLEVLDQLTHGKAGLIQRFSSFVFIGGLAALVNLVVFFIIYYRIPMPVNNVTHNIIAYIFACEISIMANFIPNDLFTFKHLSGHTRSWGTRCVRFHMTALGGSLLTFLIQFGFIYIGHVIAILSQAVALVIVLVYNFSFHHFFTYRHVKQVARS